MRRMLRHAAQRPSRLSSTPSSLRRVRHTLHPRLEIMEERNKLAQAMQAQNRYNAACAVALAGCRQGTDEAPLDEASKARWRKQAVEWLDEAALAKLPVAERESCRALWRDVDRLSNRAAGTHGAG
jgi:hypothetical protein